MWNKSVLNKFFIKIKSNNNNKRVIDIRDYKSMKQRSKFFKFYSGVLVCLDQRIILLYCNYVAHHPMCEYYLIYVAFWELDLFFFRKLVDAVLTYFLFFIFKISGYSCE
jgi:hypothetical protein